MRVGGIGSRQPMESAALQDGTYTVLGVERKSTGGRAMGEWHELVRLHGGVELGEVARAFAGAPAVDAVVAVASGDGVSAETARQGVVAGAPVDDVVAGAAEDAVIALLAATESG